MFTNNWFEITAKANFEKYVKPINSDDPNFLEIGCYEGQASLWMLENTKARLTVIDTFAGGQDLPDEKNLLNRFKKNIEPYKKRVEINVGRSQDILRAINNKKFDFIYVDGSHLAADTLEDAILSFPLLKKEGVMIFDDYTWGRHLPLPEVPAVGIDAFVFAFGDRVEILEKNSQMIIKKL